MKVEKCEFLHNFFDHLTYNSKTKNPTENLSTPLES
jgi:hypothetical protein